MDQTGAVPFTILAIALRAAIFLMEIIKNVLHVFVSVLLRITCEGLAAS